jgi:dTDP-6-deoxy-L-talose 4-dehydrogenase (NAD+)
MKVVLTGAAGFIGKPTLELLLKRGHEVLVLARHSEADASGTKGSSSGLLRWHPCDLARPDSWENIIHDFAPECALHLAWEGIPDYGLEQSLKNVVMGARLVDGLIRSGCRHLVISGSCWEYGKVRGLVREEDEPVNPGVFAASKNALRELSAALCSAGGSSLVWGRVFYPYGPAQKAISLVPTVCRAIMDGKIPSLKTPSAANDFLYVDDTAEALVLLLETRAQGMFNIGSGEPASVGKLADTLLQLAGKETIFCADVPTAANGFWADTGKLNQLGWRPRTSLEEGLRRTLDSFSTAC